MACLKRKEKKVKVPKEIECTDLSGDEEEETSTPNDEVEYVEEINSQLLRISIHNNR